MVNNLKASRSRKAKEALFYLEGLKNETGHSYQSLIAELVVESVRRGAKTDSVKQSLVNEFKMQGK